MDTDALPTHDNSHPPGSITGPCHDGSCTYPDKEGKVHKEAPSVLSIDPTYVYRGSLRNPDSVQEITAWLSGELKKPQYKNGSHARSVYIMHTAGPVPCGHLSAVAARGQGAGSL